MTGAASNTTGNIVSQEIEIVPQAQHFSSEEEGVQVILRMHFEKYRTNRGSWAVHRDVGSEVRCLLRA